MYCGHFGPAKDSDDLVYRALSLPVSFVIVGLRSFNLNSSVSSPRDIGSNIKKLSLCLIIHELKIVFIKGKTLLVLWYFTLVNWNLPECPEPP